ncbi:MAG TPA: hypothetical protein DEP57_01120 [Selenomonas sp.]|nr:hypothetical protein [Selenomonadaceae bacterium]HCB92411.1 hypothetical protein [Selenomonas sp.]
MAIIRMTLEEIAAIPDEEFKEEEERAAKLPFVYDPDCPPLTEERAKELRFHRVNPKRKSS